MGEGNGRQDVPNRLDAQSSPYLLQHAHNPVDWYPWGDEALSTAREKDVPIFLSIGYSACHWCHVMAHESFEDSETAAIMNEHFVNIKVDREERPDLDAIYMAAVVAMTGRGGWPMSVFLDPDGRPFYGGTYFPPEDRYGVPGFKRVLLSAARAYRERRGELIQWNDELVDRLNKSADLAGGDGHPLTPETFRAACAHLAAAFDSTHGGFGSAPKFPQPMTLEFLLRYHYRTGDSRALTMADLTLTHMACGGMYDQLGGGFHRYSTDAQWLVPHFEKMLYDNALLAGVYLHAWQLTGRPIYRRVVEETLDYVVREMANAQGGFYTAQDADSEGEEGRYYLWTPLEIRSLMEQQDADLLCRHYAVTEKGNFEGRNVLATRKDTETTAAAGLDESRARAAIEKGRRIMFDARTRRVKPARDEKVLTSWNGLMLAAFAEAGRLLRRPDYIAVAERNARFVLSEMRHDGRLMRSWTPGAGAKHNGYLEDYACYAYGLLALYQATFELQWFVEARTLADSILSHFADPKGGFFDTSDDHERLILRPKTTQDNAIPSGNSMTADVLLRLGWLTDHQKYRRSAELTLEQMAQLMERHPSSFGYWLGVAVLHLSSPTQIAVIGDPKAEDTAALVDVILNAYRPNCIVALSAPGGEAAEHIPLLEGRRTLEGHATAYVCSGFACQTPVTTPQDLASQIDLATPNKQGETHYAR